MFSINLYRLCTLFSAALRNKSEIISILEFKRKLSDMYKLANETMNTRQIKALTYHDRKVCNVIKENTSNTNDNPKKFILLLT